MEESRTLGNLEGVVVLLEIRCARCDRYGRERLVRLIERYGKEAPLPDVRHLLRVKTPSKLAAFQRRGSKV